MWSIVKKRNSELRPVNKRLGANHDNDPFPVASPVLVYTGVPRKLAPAFTLGHVKERVSTNRVRIIHPNGTTSIENLRNVVPMIQYDRDPPQQDDLPDE
ncbi:hypothetical protein Pmar_PMAR016705 [Perkinsus marinus ATCC 50983]|uniref:Uncharacterized protein n=1 Tax=Perkinsus marinus (strain ATCC 50983 / TXsc) TaxID=423536 RepID=C5LPY1_PERM5|nr:hypothetical protein Pmar_PMAR016705 [Perkinsus marinus ATCC 50983]EER01213.1 hypothetical protein Pmar_PMAR016705 [Perkinsus marinus ATCC 50983]|eukprot:XP_002768495.1 hypothetical protein Pmar_PMAR016705 [Perkinsus marinus ATCC 50983]